MIFFSATLGGTSIVEKLQKWFPCLRYIIACLKCKCCRRKHKDYSAIDWSTEKYPQMIELSVDSKYKQFFELFAIVGYFHKKNVESSDMYVMSYALQ